MPCDRFTIAFGTPEMLKSMFSSSIARLNLFAFDDAMPRCSREPDSSTTCVFAFDSTSFCVRSQIGLGLDWVGLENSARGASPEQIFQLAVVHL